MALADRVRTRLTDFEKRTAVIRAELELRICGALYAQRERLGLTEQQVADLMGSTQAKVSEFEHGESNATFDYISRYAAAVGLMPTVTFKRLDKPPTDND